MEYKPCRALSVLSSPVFFYIANAMVVVGEERKVSVKRDVLLQVTDAGLCVMVMTQL